MNKFRSELINRESSAFRKAGSRYCTFTILTQNLKGLFHAATIVETIWNCKTVTVGTGTDSTVPTNTVQVPITTGTATDSG